MVLHLLYNEVSGLQIAIDNYDFRTNWGPILTAFALDSMWQEVDVGNTLSRSCSIFSVSSIILSSDMQPRAVMKLGA